MRKKTEKTLFECRSCGYQAAKWLGRCPECGDWDALIELRVPQGPEGRSAASAPAPAPVPIDSVPLARETRRQTGIGEFDRVLGGGVVSGSLVLIGGDPGIGKSTLMLQALFGFAATENTVLYVSGEESAGQLRMRSRRLSTDSPHLLVAAETDVERILTAVETVTPSLLVVDSIQTAYDPALSSVPGSVAQVRQTAMRLMLLAKKTGIPVFLVGHVTKEGAIAGPRLLEHMADTVLYFEGDKGHVYRILRAVKNRFGSTDEIGVFEMKSDGLMEVKNPSAVFLAERPEKASGSVVTACLEGTRPILVELQALACNTNFGTPRRTILGLDASRVALLTAVLERKLGMHLVGHDIYMNVAGGVQIREPAVDLAVVAAVAGSFLDRPVIEDTVVLGEVGLTGEIRAVGHIDLRAGEAAKMGFSRIVVPQGNRRGMVEPKNVTVSGVQTVEAAVDLLFSGR